MAPSVTRFYVDISGELTYVLPRGCSTGECVCGGHHVDRSIAGREVDTGDVVTVCGGTHGVVGRFLLAFSHWPFPVVRWPLTVDC